MFGTNVGFSKENVTKIWLWNDATKKEMYEEIKKILGVLTFLLNHFFLKLTLSCSIH